MNIKIEQLLEKSPNLHHSGMRHPLAKGHAVYGSGGRQYESSIVRGLQRNNLMNKHEHGAGSNADAPDSHIQTHHNGIHNLEIKQTKSAMFGQFELHHDGKKWDLAPRAVAKYPHTADAIRKSGFLREVNKTWKKPSGNYDKDLKQGNVWKMLKGTDAIAAHYNDDRHTPYIQIGGGSGLYHFKKDKAGLGTTKLTGDTQLRARFKYRKTNTATGKTEYGALITMNLKHPNKSIVDLDNKEHLKNLGSKFGASIKEEYNPMPKPLYESLGFDNIDALLSYLNP